jgi:hypothetical protein
VRSDLAATRERVARIVDDLITLQGRHDLHLLNVREVQDALKLDEQQRRQLVELNEQLEARRQADFRSFQELSLEERRKRMVDEARSHEQAVAKILKDGQSQRLKQIALQQRGPMAFLDVTVTDALQMTLTQKDEVRKVLEEFGPLRRGPRPGESPDTRRRSEVSLAEGMSRVLEKLTDEQQKHWQMMVGESVVIPLRPPQGKGFFMPFGPVSR